MRIGVPKEILPGEQRVAVTPETSQGLRALGFEVLVESKAGQGIFAEDREYAAAGAVVVSDTLSLYEQADLVLKVKQPIEHPVLQQHEAKLIKPGATLIAFLHPAAPASHAMVSILAERGITSFSMDLIPRISRAQTMDALTSMSTITGYKSILLAAELLPRFLPMMGTAVGAIRPAKVLVVGAGVVGLQAIATARRLGAVVTAIDIRPAAREEARSLGAQIAGFDVPAEMAVGDGGYAKALPPDMLEQERSLLSSLLPETDVVILSALVPGETAPVLVHRQMLDLMRAGSVVVDVSIDQGGNCEATVPGQTGLVGHVKVVGIQNIPGSMPVDATWLYSRNLLNYVKNLYKDGPGKIDWSDDIVKQSLVTYQGEIVHTGTRKAMGLPT